MDFHMTAADSTNRGVSARTAFTYFLHKGNWSYNLRDYVGTHPYSFCKVINQADAESEVQCAVNEITYNIQNSKHCYL